MFNADGCRTHGLVFTTVFLGLVAVLLATRFELCFRTPLLEQGDGAVNALQVGNAKRFAELHGNYSRFEFSHPGPAFFYVYAAAEAVLHDWLHVTPSPGNAHQIAGIVLQSLFFALALTVLHAHLPWRLLPPLALLAAALHFGALREPFVSLWPPHVLLMPFLCFLVAGTALATGCIKALPLAVLSGGFLFHGHAAQPLFVGSLGGLALGLGIWRHRPADGGSWRTTARTHRTSLITAAVLTAVFLLPLIIDLVARGGRSNVAAILGRFLVNTEEGNTPSQSLLYFLSFATAARNQEVLLATLGEPARAFFVAHAWRITAWLAILVAPPLIALRWRHRLPPDPRRYLLTGGVFVAVSAAGCVLWGMVQAGGMHHFNGYFYYAIYFFGLLLAAALVAHVLAPYPMKIAGAAAVVAAAFVLARSFAAPALPETENGLGIQRGVDAGLRSDPDKRSKLLVFEHGHWHNVAGVALALQRQGTGFHVEPWWTFMFPRRHDARRLGAAPEEQASVWWITANPGGHAITPELNIHHEPAPPPTGDRTIHFHGGGNAFRYVVSGLTAQNGEHAATRLPRLILRFATPATQRDVILVFDVQADHEAGPAVPADVFFNSAPIGRIVAGPRTESSITVPGALWNGLPAATLELRFPDAKPHRVPYRPDYEWWPGWLIWTLRFESPGTLATAGASSFPAPRGTL